MTFTYQLITVLYYAPTMAAAYTVICLGGCVVALGLIYVGFPQKALK